MPFGLTVDPQQLSGVIVAVVSLLAASGTALWIALIVWTFRDMRSRSRDVFVQLIAAIVVAVLNIPGLLVYLILRPQETLSEQYQRALEEEALLQEIEEKQVCPGCGHPSKDEWRLCPYCHTKLKKGCINCTQLLELSWNVCPYCEAAQHDHDRSARRRRPSTQEQRPAMDDFTSFDEGYQQD